MKHSLNTYNSHHPHNHKTLFLSPARYTHTQAGGAPNLKLLEAAMRWKRQKMAAEGGGDGGGGDGGGGGGAAADG